MSDTALSAPFSAIVDDFDFIDDWDEKYIYIIDLGRKLPEFPEDLRSEETRVRGCASQVWLDARFENDQLLLAGDSDATIVKGLVATVIALYQGLSPTAVTALDAEAALAKLDLAEHITPQRANGVASMIARLRGVAEKALAS